MTARTAHAAARTARAARAAVRTARAARAAVRTARAAGNAGAAVRAVGAAPSTGYGIARTVFALLAGPAARAMRWPPFLAATGLGLAIVAVPAASATVLLDKDLINLLRIAAVCGGLGVAFVLDDPATRSISTVPTSRLIRHAVRAGIALPAVAAWWAAVLAVTTAGAENGIGAVLPLGDVTLEAAAISALALGLAAMGLRRVSDGYGSTIAAPGLLIVVTAMHLLPERVVLFPAPAEPRWGPAHERWTLLLVVAVVPFIWASRENLPATAPGSASLSRPADAA